MPFDTVPAALRCRPFVPYVRPLPIIWTDDDDAMLSALEIGWEDLRGAIDPEDDGSAPIDDDAPPRKRGTAQRGLPVAEAADLLSIPYGAFLALCDHHGILVLRRRRAQQRRLMTTAAKQDGFGWNVHPRAGTAMHREPFPVFDPPCLDALALVFGWPDIQGAVAALPTREERRGYLLTHHAYLPDGVIADLSGYTRTAVQRARGALAVAL